MLYIACISQIGSLGHRSTLNGDYALILMNSTKERGHMTTDFPEYTMTHIYSFYYARDLVCHLLHICHLVQTGSIVLYKCWHEN